MKRHPRKLPKRATAHSRAAKREPLAPLKNPRPVPGTAPMAPRFTPSPALDWDSEEQPAPRLGFWKRLWG